MRGDRDSGREDTPTLEPFSPLLPGATSSPLLGRAHTPLSLALSPFLRVRGGGAQVRDQTQADPHGRRPASPEAASGSDTAQSCPREDKAGGQPFGRARFLWGCPRAGPRARAKATPHSPPTHTPHPSPIQQARKTRGSPCTWRGEAVPRRCAGSRGPLLSPQLALKWDFSSSRCVHWGWRWESRCPDRAKDGQLGRPGQGECWESPSNQDAWHPSTVGGRKGGTGPTPCPASSPPLLRPQHQPRPPQQLQNRCKGGGEGHHLHSHRCRRPQAWSPNTFHRRRPRAAGIGKYQGPRPRPARRSLSPTLGLMGRDS